LLIPEDMKAAANLATGIPDDFYASHLAPVAQRRVCRFCLADMLLLTVLFMETAVVMRLFLAS